MRWVAVAGYLWLAAAASGPSAEHTFFFAPLVVPVATWSPAMGLGKPIRTASARVIPLCLALLFVHVGIALRHSCCIDPVSLHVLHAVRLTDLWALSLRVGRRPRTMSAWSPMLALVAHGLLFLEPLCSLRLCMYVVLLICCPGYLYTY